MKFSSPRFLWVGIRKLRRPVAQKQIALPFFKQEGDWQFPKTQEFILCP